MRLPMLDEANQKKVINAEGGRQFWTSSRTASSSIGSLILDGLVQH